MSDQQQVNEEHEKAVLDALQECFAKDVSPESLAILLYECGKNPTQLNFSKEIAA